MNNKSLLLSVVLAAALAACGQKQEAPKTQPAPAAAPAPAPAPAPAGDAAKSDAPKADAPAAAPAPAATPAPAAVPAAPPPGGECARDGGASCRRAEAGAPEAPPFFFLPAPTRRCAGIPCNSCPKTPGPRRAETIRSSRCNQALLASAQTNPSRADRGI